MQNSIRYLFLLAIGISIADSVEHADIIVAQDGTGNYKTIQEAVNAIPSDNAENITILIKNGIYHEKIFITKSFLSLVGESRDSTRIVYAELRKDWVRRHHTDWGSATINIDSAVTDLTLANLTVHNNYGSLYGDHDHQFAVWGYGTKIILVYCNVISDGGDALSLWNKENGMYYHSNCYFEGWVDYVCPRGWCYITDSRFYGHNLTASLWHDGDTNRDQKFVIRYSYFDGVPGFPLGRHHRDGQFYFLDCIFSHNLADEQIHYPSYSPNAKPWRWGARHYYFNCHREGGDYDWFRDNLSTAERSPSPEQITAAWTFGGKWDPEKNMPSVLPFISFPAPRNGEYIDKTNVDLRWHPSRNADRSAIFFGTSKNSMVFLGLQEKNVYPIRHLSKGVTYFWKIAELSENDTINTTIFHFTTK
jgi:pectinesterase